MKINNLLCLLALAFGHVVLAQNITGNVTDENGVPLPGATVLLEGTSQGVSTDFDVNYSIEASSGDNLVFSFVGYSSQTLTVGSNSQINVQLLPDNALEEVVVTALGIKRNTKALGYSVTQVGGEAVYDGNVTQGTIPRRMIYPNGESSTNPDSFAEAISRQGENEFTTRVWWDR